MMNNANNRHLTGLLAEQYAREQRTLEPEKESMLESAVKVFSEPPTKGKIAILAGYVAGGMYVAYKILEALQK